MNMCRKNEKDISKIFAFLRTQLQIKEKELLELQRTDPCLLAPDSDQIDLLLNAIASLQLSTDEGSFIFEFDSVSDNSSSLTSACSNGFNAIKTLPSTVWLSQSCPVKQYDRQRPSIFSHLLSLPISAYLASSFGTTAKIQNQTFNRIPMVNHLLFMPIDAFKSSSNSSSLIEIKNNKNLHYNASSTTGTTKSILNHGMIYSKEYWLQNNQNRLPAHEISCHT